MTDAGVIESGDVRSYNSFIYAHTTAAQHKRTSMRGDGASESLSAMSEAWANVEEMGGALAERRGDGGGQSEEVRGEGDGLVVGGDGVTVQLMVDGWTKAGAPRAAIATHEALTRREATLGADGGGGGGGLPASTASFNAMLYACASLVRQVRFGDASSGGIGGVSGGVDAGSLDRRIIAIGRGTAAKGGSGSGSGRDRVSAVCRALAPHMEVTLPWSRPCDVVTHAVGVLESMILLRSVATWPDVASFNSVLDGLASAGSQNDEADAAPAPGEYESIGGNGGNGGGGYGDSGVSLLSRVMSCMEVAGVRKDTTTYHHLMNVYAQQGDIGKVGTVSLSRRHRRHHHTSAARHTECNLVDSTAAPSHRAHSLPHAHASIAPLGVSNGSHHAY